MANCFDNVACNTCIRPNWNGCRIFYCGCNCGRNCCIIRSEQGYRCASGCECNACLGGAGDCGSVADVWDCGKWGSYCASPNTREDALDGSYIEQVVVPGVPCKRDKNLFSFICASNLRACLANMDTCCR